VYTEESNLRASSRVRSLCVIQDYLAKMCLLFKVLSDENLQLLDEFYQIIFPTRDVDQLEQR